MRNYMIDLDRQRGPLNIIDTPTVVECGREVRFRRSFRSIVECMAPCCGLQTTDSDSVSVGSNDSTTHCSGTVTGTFFGHRRGRVSFCLQDDTRAAPLLLLEFAVPTSYLAREMQYGILRITLECVDRRKSGLIFDEPVWSMYCNGRKVGFAVRRQMVGADSEVLRLMRSVSAGAGVLPMRPTKSEDGDGELMYLRAGFERVIGSVDSESFHMINPLGSSGQELSIFLLRS